MVPASMLLPVSPDGLTATRHGGQVLLRGRHLALQGEPELVDAVRGTAGVRYLDRDLMDIAAESLSEPSPLNLRQGTFARPSDFRVDWGRARRMGWLVAGIVGAMLAVQVVEVLHYSFAARSLESRMETAAREVLPSGTAITDPHAQLRAYLQATGAGGGFARVAAALFEGLQASGARLETLDYNPDGALRATVRTGRGQTLDTLTEQLAARGYALVEGASRGDAEGQRTDIEVTPQ
jgi:general secretion pathway protein L